jgi:hypothetical protein
MNSEGHSKKRLIMDFSAIGIPTTPNTQALEVHGIAFPEEGISSGDLLIIEHRQSRSGELLAHDEDTLRLSRSSGEVGIALVVVGLIRKF